MLLSDAHCRPDAGVILQVLADSGYRPHDGVSSTPSVSLEPPSSLEMAPVLESRGRHRINSRDDTASAKPPSQGVDVSLNTLTHVRRAEHDQQTNNRNKNSINSCEGTTSPKLSNQGIDIALNMLTLVRRAERDKTVNSRNGYSTNSCEGTTSAKPSRQDIDVALKTDTLSRRAKREQPMKKTVTFAPSASLSYSSSGSDYETDVSSFGMSGSFSASPRSLFNTSGHYGHSHTEMSRGTDMNQGTDAPESPNLHERKGCSTNRNPDTGRCADIISNTDPGDSLKETASTGSGYETDYDTDRDIWINDQLATLQPDIAQTIGREVFVALYPTLNIKDEMLFTLHLTDLLEDYDDEEVCDKIKRLWRLEKEKRERDGGR